MNHEKVYLDVMLGSNHFHPGANSWPTVQSLLQRPLSQPGSPNSLHFAKGSFRRAA